MNQTHWTFVANAAAQALAMLDAKEITRQDFPRTLGGRLSQWRG
jgi:hypothetical protein